MPFYPTPQDALAAAAAERGIPVEDFVEGKNLQVTHVSMRDPQTGSPYDDGEQDRANLRKHLQETIHMYKSENGVLVAVEKGENGYTYQIRP